MRPKGILPYYLQFYISTKVLLTDFQPVEILFFRFVTGTLALFLVSPHLLKGTTWKQELVFMSAGRSGVCLYYLLENIALTFTMASNVGVIISVAPFFTALLSRLFLKQEEKLTPDFLSDFSLQWQGSLWSVLTDLPCSLIQSVICWRCLPHFYGHAIPS